MKLNYLLKGLTMMSGSLLLLGITACSSNSSSSDSSSLVNESSGDTAAQVAHNDSTSTKEASKESGKVWGTKTFATAADAINYMNSSPDASKYSAGIFHRMAEENLSYLTKLLNSPYERFIVVDKEVMRVILYDKYGREILGYGMACARNYGTKHRKADSRTPEGFFSAEGVYDSTDWLFTNDYGYTSPARGQFGPRFIRVKNPVTTQIGIHGTGSPRSIGHRVSHGCIRIKNENILELVKYVEKDMPIIINPSRRDTNVNKSEGYDIPYITTDVTGEYREKLQAQYDEEAKMAQELAKKKAEEKANAQKQKNTVKTDSVKTIPVTKPIEEHESNATEPTPAATATEQPAE